MVNEHRPHPDQTRLENKACSLHAKGLPKDKTVEELFGPMEEWIFKLDDKWQLLLMPVTKRWWFYDQLHEDWQDTGYDLGSVFFYLEKGLLEAESLNQSDATETVPPPPPPLPADSSPFSKAESCFASLKAESDRGAISRDHFLKKLSELRFQDASGTWWQLAEDGVSWLKWDGNQWVEKI